MPQMTQFRFLLFAALFVAGQAARAAELELELELEEREEQETKVEQWKARSEDVKEGVADCTTEAQKWAKKLGLAMKGLDEQHTSLTQALTRVQGEAVLKPKQEPAELETPEESIDTLMEEVSSVVAEAEEDMRERAASAVQVASAALEAAKLKMQALRSVRTSLNTHHFEAKFPQSDRPKPTRAHTVLAELSSGIDAATEEACATEALQWAKQLGVIFNKLEGQHAEIAAALQGLTDATVVSAILPTNEESVTIAEMTSMEADAAHNAEEEMKAKVASAVDSAVALVAAAEGSVKEIGSLKGQMNRYWFDKKFPQGPLPQKAHTVD